MTKYINLNKHICTVYILEQVYINDIIENKKMEVYGMGTASTKAKNKYNAENYERISLSVPKGYKDRYKKAAAKQGKSLNKFIVDCIEVNIVSCQQKRHNDTYKYMI